MNFGRIAFKAKQILHKCSLLGKLKCFKSFWTPPDKFVKIYLVLEHLGFLSKGLLCITIENMVWYDKQLFLGAEAIKICEWM